MSTKKTTTASKTQRNRFAIGIYINQPNGNPPYLRVQANVSGIYKSYETEEDAITDASRLLGRNNLTELVLLQVSKIVKVKPVPVEIETVACCEPCSD